jgi:selenocysteine-specific elongation factor
LKPIILGTAGHIDHGKTSLVKALTGIDTDRLKEEKRRGITIELGFASLTLPSGQKLGIVDVPGHEKFVKNMVAGATGIDMVAMVIAADEGVMPQTREHLEICTLLGIRYGLVVLTKIDLVDDEWTGLVKEDIGEFVQGTFLEGSPIVPVSAITKDGLNEFISALDDLWTQIPARTSTGLFRLPIDRVFSMKGFGTVITGTLVSGRVRVGDTITTYPSGITAKVRGIQVHNQGVTEAEAGMRTAINFQGIEKAAVNRGEVVAKPGTLKPSYMVDGSIHFLSSNKRPVKSRTRIRFHTGTSEVLGNLVLLESEELKPSETATAQIRLESPVAIMKDDFFVIRSYSPIRTIGGGQILNPLPQKHKGHRPEAVSGLKSLLNSEPEEIVSYFMAETDYTGISIGDLKIMTNLPDKPLNQILQKLLSTRKAIQSDKENQIFIHSDVFAKLQNQTVQHLQKYHQDNPLKGGMPKEELRSKFPSLMESKLFNLILNQLIKDKTIIPADDTVRLSTHFVSLRTDQAQLKEKILRIYLDSSLTPPYFKELSKSLDIDPRQAKDVLMLLVQEGLVTKVKEELYFHAGAIADLKNRLADFIVSHGEITTPQFKAMTQVSRKYLIPLLEYFDSQNVTIRIGDVRKLRRQ